MRAVQTDKEITQTESVCGLIRNLTKSSQLPTHNEKQKAYEFGCPRMEFLAAANNVQVRTSFHLAIPKFQQQCAVAPPGKARNAASHARSQ